MNESTRNAEERRVIFSCSSVAHREGTGPEILPVARLLPRRQLQDRPRQVGAGRAPVVQALLSLRDNGGL